MSVNFSFSRSEGYEDKGISQFEDSPKKESVWDYLKSFFSGAYFTKKAPKPLGMRTFIPIDQERCNKQTLFQRVYHFFKNMMDRKPRDIEMQVINTYEATAQETIPTLKRSSSLETIDLSSIHGDEEEEDEEDEDLVHDFNFDSLWKTWTEGYSLFERRELGKE